MKRIAYLLVNAEGEIYRETKTFPSLRNAEKEIEYGLRKGHYEEGDWTPKKIVLEGYSGFENSISQSWVIDEIKIVIGVMTWFQLLVLIFRLIQGSGTALLEIAVSLTLIGLGVCLLYFVELLVFTIVFIRDVFAWLNYKKEDSSHLDRFSLVERELLFKEGVVFGGS